MTDNRNQPNVAVFLDIDGCVSPLPRQNPYGFDIDEQYNYETVQPMVPVCDHVADWLTGPHPGATLVWSTLSSREAPDSLTREQQRKMDPHRVRSPHRHPQRTMETIHN